MIILEGNITNKVINGKNGDFSVGNLNTEIGQFKIRNQLLDQFDEGEYRVRVSIQHLDLNSYMLKRNGITITEIEAHIDHIEVIDADIKAVETESVEPDASIEPETTDKSTTDEKLVDNTSADQTDTVKRNPADKQASVAAESDQTDLKKLFGLLWPLGDVVQLDSTTPRNQFIRQKDYLKAKGYKFHSPNQSWHK
jgi:hypothetical protein